MADELKKWFNNSWIKVRMINSDRAVVFDDENDFEMSFDIKGVHEVIYCLKKIYEAYVCKRETQQTGDWLCENAYETKEAYNIKGNWVTIRRIPFIIEIMEDFFDGNLKINKEDLLKDLDNMTVYQLCRLVNNIKRKEKANA